MFEEEELAAPPRRLRRPARIALLVLVLAVIAGGLVYRYARSGSGAITVHDAKLDNAADVLTGAEGDLRTYVSVHRGVLATDSRCYFERLPSRRSSDVTNTVLCGPVLFFHGSPARPYLEFRFTAAPAAGGAVHASLGPQPLTTEPVAAPRDSTLVRPDARSHPLVRTELPVPQPPPAPTDVLRSIDATYPANLPVAPRNAVLGSNYVTVALQEAGPVASYGQDDAERAAPRGQHLFAFLLALSGGENDSYPLPDVQLGVRVGSGPARRVALGDSASQEFVVATPSSDPPLSLVLQDAGFVQQLDLRTGRPAAGNITFLRNGIRAQLTNGYASAPADESGTTKPLTVLIDRAAKFFFVPPDNIHPRSPHDVFLMVGLCHLVRTASDQSCDDLQGRDLTITPAGARPVSAMLESDPYYPWMFEVPAGMTSGTLILRGTVTVGPSFSARLVKPLVLHFDLTPQT